MKRKIFFMIIILTIASVLPGTQQALYAEPGYSLHSGLNLMHGLIYNRSWDPGYSGTSATLSVTRENGILLLGLGAEAGYSYTGFNLLFPLQAGIVLKDGSSLKLSASGAVMPGLILSRPSPYFLFAAEISAMLSCRINEGFSLELSAGPRFTSSPGYSDAVAPLELLDVNIGFSAVFDL